MFSIFYKKNNNKDLFKSLEEIVDSTKNQNYIPIYKNFFNINNQNFNNINLNHKYNLQLINSKKTENIYNCSLTFGDNQTLSRDSFFKFSPLLDPLKYMTGKYKNITDDDLLSLPVIEKSKCLEKVNRINNSAYIDSFFSYLSSQLLHEHDFIHGLDFYGSFICIKNKYEFDIIDDLEFLNDSTYFHKNKNIKYNITKSSNINLFSETTRNYKEKIEFLDDNLSFEIDDTCELKFDDLFIKNSKPLTVENLKQFNLKNNVVFEQDISNNKKSLSSSSSSTSCSSRTSKTSEESENVSLDSDYMESNSKSSNSNSEDSDNSENESTLSSNITAKARINEFPVQLISLELMDNTMDELLELDGEDILEDKEWISCFFQIIITLITYQKAFNFTHNDLHTNNIMYKNTDKKFIYYLYNSKYYKVPTYGKIYKIIDFGRAIYKYKDKVVMSDSFHPKGDAAGQYNYDCYYNKEKPEIKPNNSFDLCRLGTSLFDFFVDDIVDLNMDELSPVERMAVSWCYDDKGKNVLYKNNGTERYPDFKLYKMISRNVHNHDPSEIIKDNLFKRFLSTKKKIGKKSKIINIDKIPSYVN